MKINWKNTPSKTVTFSTLNVGDTFKNTHGHGAVYMKVKVNSDVVRGGYTESFGMLELQTGKVFKPTSSPLELVDVEITVDTVKPSIY